MVIGFIILGLFGFIFAGAVGLMVKSYINSKKETEQTEEHEITDDNKKFEKEMWFLTIAAFICMAVMLISIIYITVIVVKAEQIPETEVIETTIESTSAPDETIIPSTEETIHIEETEATSETESEPEATTDIDISPETPSKVPSEAPEGSVTDKSEIEIDPEELEMLACVIYQEAGGNGSCDNCRKYVADIVLNRIEHPKFPDTMYEVLTAYRQYGMFYWTGIKWPERAKYDVEKEAVARAYRTAEEVLSGQHSELYGQGYIWQAKFVQGTDGFWCCGHYYGRG